MWRDYTTTLVQKFGLKIDFEKILKTPSHTEGLSFRDKRTDTFPPRIFPYMRERAAQNNV